MFDDDDDVDDDVDVDSKLLNGALRAIISSMLQKHSTQRSPLSEFKQGKTWDYVVKVLCDVCRGKDRIWRRKGFCCCLLMLVVDDDVVLIFQR